MKVKESLRKSKPIRGSRKIVVGGKIYWWLRGKNADLIIWNETRKKAVVRFDELYILLKHTGWNEHTPLLPSEVEYVIKKEVILWN